MVFLKVLNCLALVAVAGVLVYNIHVTSLRNDNAQEESHRRNKRSVPTESSGNVDRSDTSEPEPAPAPAAGGALYTRWGRSSCPGNGTELIYSGVAAGQWFDHTGGGSNYLCLPLDPIWATFNTKLDNKANIYGGEYEFANSFPYNSGPIANILNHNVPCAVCRVATRSSALMLPARNECYEGWTLEYWGYLAAGHYGHKGRTEYVCMDEKPEGDDSGYRDENGALFYSVEGRCGSLPCPPYAEGRELTCSVCTA